MMIPPILPLYERADVNFTKGEGVYLTDENGKQYLDFASGYAANSLGHCHPDLVKALTKQATIFWHLSNRYKIPGLEAYSKRLIDLSFGDTVFIANSGAEAVECMIKMCRRYFNAQGKKNKYRIITLDGAFHGRTLATATAGGVGKMDGFEPPVDGFDRVAWNDIDALKAAITPNTAGVLLEPIQGEGGMRVLDKAYMKQLRELCDQRDMLLLVDEVQCGMGRTGRMFAYELFDIKPDLMALGKGLGCGFPVSACIATEKVGKAMSVHSHGSTFGGNPLAVAVGSAVLNVMTQPAFLKQVCRVAEYLYAKLKKLKVDNPSVIEDVTGYGLMLGVKLKGAYPAEQFSTFCREEGLLTMPASGNVSRLTPPLIIDEGHCDEAVGKIAAVIGRL